MIKISEKEIEKCLQEFSKRDILLSIKGLVIAEVKMVLSKCVYDRNIGILKISNSQASFEFNTSFLYKTCVSDDSREMQLYFDNGVYITIRKGSL